MPQKPHREEVAHGPHRRYIRVRPRPKQEDPQSSSLHATSSKIKIHLPQDLSLADTMTGTHSVRAWHRMLFISEMKICN
ncbi:hypothetical protein Pelo_16605 [Pelomyxa schiedti]|nr:hypothetical protein Pelo_16605 [Pelomyxa schiedti]